MSKVKRGLGKGLGALIVESDTDQNHSPEGYREVAIDLIKPNREQPRRTFDDELLSSLSESIKEHGILQPLIVKSVKHGYELIAGERRWRASRLAGVREVPVVIKKDDNEKNVQIALIENLQREDLNSIEEGEAYRSLMNEFGYTQDKVAKTVGKSRSHIANVMRLSNLPHDIKGAVIDGRISGGHGRALLALDSETLMFDLAVKIENEELSVREVERLVKRLMEPAKEREPEVKDANVVYVEKQMTSKFNTKVSIKTGKKKGKIEIEFYNDDDLTRIIDLLELK